MQSSRSDLGTSIREALQSDTQRIAALALQLGYEVPPAHVERQLQTLGPNRAVLVAVVPRAGVIGWIGISQYDTLTESGRAYIEGLVVEDEYRGNGIGELLLSAAEGWARGRGCTAIRLQSNVVRERAHGFYLRLGYEIMKTQHAFKKAL